MTMISEPATRPAAVAGMFYPASASELRRRVDELLEGAAARAQAAAPKALIAPHAGYVYSGAIAASAYAQLGALGGRIRRVVLLGPAHRVAVRGLALAGAQRFATPLGEVEVDQAAVDRLRELPQVIESPRAHALEHSLEVQLPFLQQALGRFELVPLAVGDAGVDEVAEVIETLWGGAETLIVVSSDLSHYLPYAAAREIDRRTAEHMLALHAQIDHRQACGATPVNGLLKLARRRAMKAELLDLRNSGDTAGDRSRVVGYAALAFYETAPAAEVDAAQSAAAGSAGPLLLAHARSAIVEALGLPARPAPDSPLLARIGASFVTLRKRGELRGCVGTLEPYRPLREDVRGNAQAAAFRDPRFSPLVRSELAALAVEVSLLSACTPVEAGDEEDLLRQLRPHIDGLVFEYRGHRGTLLPQVWASLPQPRGFVAALKHKASLPVDFWSSELRISRYTVEKFAESEAAW